MANYYSIFNLGLAKQKGIITDEMVEKAYLAKKSQYLELTKKNNKKEINSEVIKDCEEVKAYEQGNYLKMIEEAYNAIKTQECRKKYDESLKAEEYKLVKGIVKNAIRKIIREGNVKYNGKKIEVSALDKQEMRNATEQLITQLLEYANEEPNITGNKRKAIIKKFKLVISLFDEVYDESYNECMIDKNKKSKQHENKPEHAITQKAEIFNQLIRSNQIEIQKGNLGKVGKELKDRIEYTPIYKGKYGQIALGRGANNSGNKDSICNFTQER